MSKKKELLRHRRHLKIRKKVQGTSERPRLVVFRSLSHIYAQLIDDTSKKVLLSISDLKGKFKGKKSEKSRQAGMELANLAKEKKITTVTFDRNGYKYHGRVKALADGAREGGLIF